MNPALYIHIPFCLKKCPYCSFPVVVHQEAKAFDYVRALLDEAHPFKGRSVSTVYVGGGTPSMLDEEAVLLLSGGLSSMFKACNAEATFEFNPESTTFKKASCVRRAGFNRASLGVQSFNGVHLSYLGRTHDGPQGFSAFKMLREAGFDNISIDLMFGFPAQTRDELDGDIDTALKLNSEHLSIYALTVEGKTLFDVRKIVVDDQMQADAYRHIVKRLNDAGFRQYEVSNFSREGFQSRHNINYWQGGDYIGLGVGAHGHLQGERYWNAPTFPTYMALMRAHRSAVVGRERLEVQAKMMECFLFGLRMNSGVDLMSLEKRFSVTLSPRVKDQVALFIQDGLFTKGGSTIAVTDAGRLVLDEISVKLL